MPDNVILKIGPGRREHVRANPSFTMSNRRPSLQAKGREAELRHLAIASAARAPGGARRVRTDDLMLAKHALYQLSYGPERRCRSGRVVGPGRLELPTLRLSGVRSNHLSYEPIRTARLLEARAIAPHDLEPDPVGSGRPAAGWKEKRRRRTFRT